MTEKCLSEKLFRLLIILRRALFDNIMPVFLSFIFLSLLLFPLKSKVLRLFAADVAQGMWNFGSEEYHITG